MYEPHYKMRLCLTHYIINGIHGGGYSADDPDYIFVYI